MSGGVLGLGRRARAAMRVLRGNTPPPVLIAPRFRDDLMDDEVAREVLDLTLRMGEILVSAGSPVARVTAIMLRVAARYGLTSCQVDITFTSITVAVTRDDGDPLSNLRLVRVRSADYSRLQSVYDLVDAITDGQPGEPGLSVQEASGRLDTIVQAPHPYKRWLVTVALAGMAAAVGGLLGGGPPVALVAALVTAALDRLMRTANRRGLPFFFQQAMGAAFVTLIAVGILVALKYIPFSTGLTPGLVVGSGILVLLAGLGLVGAAEDAISGHYLTAAARTFEVLLQTIGIVAGVGAVLDLSRRAGVELVVIPNTSAQLPAAGLIALAAAVSGCWALSSYARLRAVLIAAAGGGAAYAIYALASNIGIGPAVASGAAALVVGAASDVAGDRFKVPTLVIATSGVVPLLPGLSIYRAIFTLVQGSPFDGLTLLLGAGTVGLGLASGVALGAYVAHPLRGEVDRWERRVRRRSRSTRD